MLRTYLDKLLLTATAGLFLFAAGCVDPKTEATPTSAPPRPVVASSPPLAVTPAEKAIKDLATDADPRVQVAVLNAQGLRDSEGKLHALYARVKPKLDPSRLGKNWETKDLSPDDFKAACRALREMADELEAAHVEFVLVADRYEEQLGRGPQAYRVAAAYFQDRSVKSSERLFRDGYAELAVFSERFAVLIEERKKAFTRFRAEVTETRDYLKTSARYVRDVEGVASFTPATDGGDFRASHRSFLLVYVRAFNEFLDQTAGFTDGLKARPLPASPAEPQPAPGGGYEPGKNMPPGSFASKYPFFNYRETDPAAAVNQALRQGEAYALSVREVWADHYRLDPQLDRYAGKPLPPALEAELADYDRRVNAAKAIRTLTISGSGPFEAGLSSPGPSVGDYLPVVRFTSDTGGSPTVVGVVRVEAVSGGRMTLRAVHGSPQANDRVIQAPGG